MELSVIIPFYNSGLYLYDAIKSIEASTNIEQLEYEIIIVNDGSTEAGTEELLNDLTQKGYLVVSQPNAGPAAARNAGINIACGKYFLFLDSDNKVKETFIEKGISLLQTKNVDLVYGKPVFFGDSTEPRFQTGKFDINKIIVGNYIDTCCIIKRDACLYIGGFDEDRRIIGLEDWEFYIHLYSKGCDIYYIDSEVYYYRILKDSLSQQHNSNYLKEAYAYIYRKHRELVPESVYLARDGYEKSNEYHRKSIRGLAQHAYRTYMPLKVRKIVRNLLFS